MKILGTQDASIQEKNFVIVERIHGVYGKYYEIIEESKNTEPVLFICKPLPVVELQSDTERATVKSVNSKRKSKAK